MSSREDLAGFRLAITGVGGFVGRHLAALAASQGATVIGVGRVPAGDAQLSGMLTEHVSADLRRSWPLQSPVDAVVHLAGLSAVGPSFADPQRYIHDNSAMVTVMCEALLNLERPPRLLGVSTGAVYRAPPDGDPVTEASPTQPGSPYALSKLLVESQLEYYRSRGLETLVARPFNHAGPGQLGGFLIPDLVQRISQLRGPQALTVGELDTARDYTHVRDVAAAYLMLASEQRLSHDVYNVASGRSVTGRHILDLICHALHRSVPPLQVSESLLRPNDPKVITGSAELLRRDTGWVPNNDIGDVVREYVDSLPGGVHG